MCVQSALLYLVLRADYLRGRPGLSFHPCTSPQTGNGPLPVQMYLLYCKKALQRERTAKLGNSQLFKVDYLHKKNPKPGWRETDKHTLANGVVHSTDF